MALKKGDVLKCLTQFKSALDAFGSAQVLPDERAALKESISALQSGLTSNEGFKKIFGPVTFADADIESTAAFLDGLIQAYAEQVVEGVEGAATAPMPDREEKQESQAEEPDPAEMKPEDRIEAIIGHIKTEKADEAKALIGGDEDILTRVLNRLNSHGMSCRKAGRIEEAINSYESCLLVCDNDEGIYFNLARAYMEGGQVEEALQSINKALAINPDFPEGQALQGMISAGMAA
jgi:tetratricopeptide (TPR) repeat protein